MERPIILKAHEVRGILNGRQTQFRRIIKVQPENEAEWAGDFVLHSPSISVAVNVFNQMRGKMLRNDPTPCPYGQPGDLLWVRETWRAREKYDRKPDSGPFAGSRVIYEADAPHEKGLDIGRKRPSTQMPRWASRILLEIVSVRVERVQDISEVDALAQGADYEWHGVPVGQGPNFVRQWISDHSTESWDANQWVWVVEFKRVEV